MEALRCLLPQIRQGYVVAYARQQMGGYLLLAVPALLVAEDKARLAQGPTGSISCGVRLPVDQYTA